MRIRSCQFLLDSFRQSWRYLDDIVFDQRQKLVMIIAKKIKDGLCSATSSGTRLYDSYLISFLFFLVMLMCSFQIVCYCHAVVGLEYFARSQPCVLRIVFCQLVLVIIITDELFKVQRSLQFAHLKIYVIW